MTITCELYPDRSGKWRFRFRAANGKITAASGENFYTGRYNARRAARAFIRSIGGDPDRVKFVEVGR